MITPPAPPSNMQVAAHYDELDAFYREIWGEHLHHGYWDRGNESVEQAVGALVERVAAAGRIGCSSDVCDVGCGYGATARILAKRGARVVGFTLSRAQAERARSAAAGPNAPTFVLGDWLENHLSSQSFDAVIAIESSEHIADKERLFSEAKRVLRPGGRLVVCAWLACDTPRRWHRRHLLQPICVEGQIAGLASAAETIAWMNQAGFVEVTHEDLTASVRRTWAICSYRLLAALGTEPRYRSFLVSGPSEHRIFALSVLRIAAAYAVGAMKYGLFTATR